MTLFESTDSPPAAPSGPSVRVRLQIAYDGRRFHGFAPQPGGVRTVGGVIVAALQRVLRLDDPPPIVCAGRTDAGVHAWDQWAQVDVPGVEVAADGLQRRLLKMLGPEVVIRSVDVAPEGWDARRSALRRTYRYTILTSPTPDPFRAGFVWWRPGGLDLRAMQLAADAVLGEHDFGSFCRAADAITPSGREAGAPSGREAGTPSGREGRHLVRTVRACEWSTPEPDTLRFEITADAFCQQMVRSIVGTLADVGSGRLKAGELLAILHARDRAVAGAVAPPDGLCLWKVAYD